MFAAVFPGQGSQKPGMGQDLLDLPTARSVFETVSEAVGRDVAALCAQADEEELRQTQNAQIALFACGIAAYRAFREEGGAEPAVCAGHSVGEYAALVAAGVLDLADGARLVQRRGQLMAELGDQRPGAMAAIVGLERSAVEEVCRSASRLGVVVIANDNCPGQLVVSGDRDAVEAAKEGAGAAGARMVVALNVSGAFHSPLMVDAARAMGEMLRNTAFASGNCPVISNVTAEPVEDCTRWPRLLESQLESTVRWTESMQRAAQMGVTRLLEFGSGNVLCGLMKRIERGIAAQPVFDRETLAQALGA
jgi:[acyl-carrier-protein] S-malonyltransferase